MLRTNGWLPWVYIGPAVLVLTVYLVYPTLNTLSLSFFGPDSTHFVGLNNYASVFTRPEMLTAFKNNLLWLGLFTTMTVGLGLLIAVLADRLPYEALAKAVVFIPMSISFVAAGVIWKFIYEFKPLELEQIGLLNAIATAFPNGEPIAWLVNPTINNFALVVVGIWMWTGFAVVVLSAGLKGIPTEVLEAARVDGASEWHIFWRITVPLLTPTIAVVATTLTINVLKVFDIVYVMTNGDYGTDVIANRMYKEMFNYQQFGHASAIAVVLFLTIIPVMWFNIHRFRAQEQAQ